MSLPLLSIWNYFGTVGLVVLGSVLTLGTTVVVEERRLRRDARRDAEQASHRLRTAARLVREELIDALVHLEVSVENGRWWSHEVDVLSRKEWDEHRAALADGIESTEQWHIVSSAYSHVRLVNERRVQLGPGHFDIGDDRRLVTSTVAEAESAQRALASMAEPSHSAEATADGLSP